jgi:hypothetical protein
MAMATESADTELTPLSSSSIISEVISRQSSPVSFDWRSAGFELNIGYGYIDEANNFENEVIEITPAFPSSSGITYKAIMRRVKVFATDSTNTLGRSPFVQAAGVTRYQLGAGINYSVLEGRSITLLSPSVPDFEHVLFLSGALTFNHPNDGLIPRKSEPPKILLGQRPVNSPIVYEFGLRWQIYTPKSLGFYFEMDRAIPASDTKELRGWTYFSMGVLWSSL